MTEETITRCAADLAREQIDAGQYDGDDVLTIVVDRMTGQDRPPAKCQS